MRASGCWVTPAGCVCCSAPALGSSSEHVWHETAPACPVPLLWFSYRGSLCGHGPYCSSARTERPWTGQVGGQPSHSHAGLRPEHCHQCVSLDRRLGGVGVCCPVLTAATGPEHRRGPRPTDVCGVSVALVGGGDCLACGPIGTLRDWECGGCLGSIRSPGPPVRMSTSKPVREAPCFQGAAP